ncbi:MAG: TIGR02281 family clan AA aspartic protease [Parvibaculaceae bacterium]
MAGWLGVFLCVVAGGVALLADPSMLSSLSGLSPIAMACVLLVVAALSALLGLLSPSWSMARQASNWSGIALAAIVIGANFNDAASVFLAEPKTTQEEPAPPEPTAQRVEQVTHAGRSVSIKAGDHGHYVARVEIERTPITVLIDTGATKVVMSYEDAEHIGLKPFSLDFRAAVSTANGTVKAAPVTLNRVEIANIQVRDVEALVLPEGAMRGTLLGMSFLNRLSNFRVSEGTLILQQ